MWGKNHRCGSIEFQGFFRGDFDKHDSLQSEQDVLLLTHSNPYLLQNLCLNDIAKSVATQSIFGIFIIQIVIDLYWKTIQIFIYFSIKKSFLFALNQSSIT